MTDSKCTACKTFKPKFGNLCGRCHRKFLGEIKDLDKNPYAGKLMQQECTCCPVHKSKLETLIHRLGFVAFELDR